MIRPSSGRLADFDLSGLSLARRYLLVSLVFVVIGGGVVALALGQLIETSAINRTTSVTALYVESFVAPELQTLATSPNLSQAEIDSLQRLLTDSPLGQAVVSFRAPVDGRALSSTAPFRSSSASASTWAASAGRRLAATSSATSAT